MRALLVCLLLVACGDDDDDVGAIDAGEVAIDGGMAEECPDTLLGSCLKVGGRCIEVYADVPEEAIASNCEQDGSTWHSAMACLQGEVIGHCLLAGGGACQKTFYQAPYDTQSAQAECTQGGGTFTPL